MAGTAWTGARSVPRPGLRSSWHPGPQKLFKFRCRPPAVLKLDARSPDVLDSPTRPISSFVLSGLAEKCVWDKFALLLARCWSSLDNRPGREAVAFEPLSVRVFGFRWNQVPAGSHVGFAGAPQSGTRLRIRAAASASSA